MLEWYLRHALTKQRANKNKTKLSHIYICPVFNSFDTVLGMENILGLIDKLSVAFFNKANKQEKGSSRFVKAILITSNNICINGMVGFGYELECRSLNFPATTRFSSVSISGSNACMLSALYSSIQSCASSSMSP